MWACVGPLAVPGQGMKRDRSRVTHVFYLIGSYYDVKWEDRIPAPRDLAANVCRQTSTVGPMRPWRIELRPSPQLAFATPARGPVSARVVKLSITICLTAAVSGRRFEGRCVLKRGWMMQRSRRNALGPHSDGAPADARRLADEFSEFPLTLVVRMGLYWCPNAAR